MPSISNLFCCFRNTNTDQEATVSSDSFTWQDYRIQVQPSHSLTAIPRSSDIPQSQVDTKSLQSFETRSLDSCSYQTEFSDSSLNTVDCGMVFVRGRIKEYRSGLAILSELKMDAPAPILEYFSETMKDIQNLKRQLERQLDSIEPDHPLLHADIQDAKTGIEKLESEYLLFQLNFMP